MDDVEDLLDAVDNMLGQAALRDAGHPAEALREGLGVLTEADTVRVLSAMHVKLLAMGYDPRMEP